MNQHDKLLKEFLKGCEPLHVELSKENTNKIFEYIALLEKWNKFYNLTANADPEILITRHVLDSLAITSHVLGQRVLDVGSGAGFPGIPLALALPDKSFVLLDSNNKKIRFLQHAAASLHITNIEAVHTRVEHYKPTNNFDTIVSRAFSSLLDMVAKTKHLYNTNGILLAMKGKYPQMELLEISLPTTVVKLEVPYLAEERHLVCINF